MALFNSYYTASDFLRGCKFTSVDHLCNFESNDLPEHTSVKICNEGYPVENYANPDKIKRVWKGREAEIVSPRVLHFANDDLTDGEYYFVRYADFTPYLMEKQYFTVIK